ncbi:MAG: hypothetical protein JW969_19010 [Spirochaetales bacterium]|nr:hypothetical protein [Spirochaetales bacterium]
MKQFNKIINEQKEEIARFRVIVDEVIAEKVTPNAKILGALLTGSVARGDARVGPFGIFIDIAIILKNKSDIDMEQIFGKDEEPFIPYHCISVKNKTGIAMEVIEEDELWKIREQPEPVIFARNESIILNDKTGSLQKWKNECFVITEDQIKQRALNNYFRYDYLTGEYRLEKWEHREAWVQIAQNYNEANECYCNFLYCINGLFIPRKDWLAYLTYEMKIKPEEHESCMNKMYENRLDAGGINGKKETYNRIKNWMDLYCKNKKWL